MTEGRRTLLLKIIYLYDTKVVTKSMILMMAQLPHFWCLSCQQQKIHRKRGSCDVILVLLIS